MRRRRHPIPPKRKVRRRALWCAFGTLVLSAVLAVLLACRFAPEPHEIVIPEEPPVHELPVETAPPSGTWTRYDVPFSPRYQRYVAELCTERDIDPALVWAVMSAETHGTYYLWGVGDGGESFGPMQIWAACHEERMDRLGVSDITDARQNVLVGVDLLAELIGEGHGVEWALTYYNAGGQTADRYAAEGRTSPYAAEVLDTAEVLRSGAEVCHG